MSNKQFRKPVHKETRFETELLDFKGKRREEAMNAYRRILLSSADQLIYFTKIVLWGQKSLRNSLKRGL